MRETCKVEIHKQTRLFDDFFEVDEILVAHEQRNGTMSSDQRRLVFERGDAVAALLYEPDTHTVIMVDQFRVPTLIARRRDNPANHRQLDHGSRGRNDRHWRDRGGGDHP